MTWSISSWWLMIQRWLLGSAALHCASASSRLEAIPVVQHYPTVHFFIMEAVPKVQNHPTVHFSMLEAVCTAPTVHSCKMEAQPDVQHQLYTPEYWRPYLQYIVTQLYTLAYYTRGSTCGTTLPNFTLLHIESSKCGTSSPNCTPCHAGGSTSGTVTPGILFCILEAVRAVLYPPTSTVQGKRQYQRHSTSTPSGILEAT